MNSYIKYRKNNLEFPANYSNQAFRKTPNCAEAIVGKIQYRCCDTTVTWQQKPTLIPLQDGIVLVSVRTRCSRVREKQIRRTVSGRLRGSNYKVCVRIVKRLNRDEDVTWIKSAVREAAKSWQGKVSA